MDLIKEGLDLLSDVLLFDLLLLSIVSLAHPHLLGLEVLLAELKTHGHSTQLPVIELEAGVVVLSVVNSRADSSLLQLLANIVGVLHEIFRVVVLFDDRNNHHLSLGNAGRQHQALVVRVDHDHSSNGPGGETPGSLPGVLLLALGVLIGHVEHLAEVGSELMGSSSLDATAGNWHVDLHRSGEESTSELLILRLLSLDAGDSQEILVDVGVIVEDLENPLGGVLLVSVGSVALLPEELAGSDEGSGVLELPSDDVSPLVDLEGEVSVGTDPLRECGVHNSFGSRSDGDGLVHLGLAGLGYPSDLGREPFKVVLFLLEGTLRDEHREVGVLGTAGLEASVEVGLDLLPDVEGARAEDVATGDVIIVDKLSLSDHLLVPLREVGILLVQNGQLVAIGSRFLLVFLALLLLFGAELLALLLRLLLVRLRSSLGGTSSAVLRGNLGEINNLEVLFGSARELDDGVDSLLVDGGAASVVHGVETAPLGLVEGLVKEHLDVPLGVVNSAEEVDHALSASEELSERFLVSSAQIPRGHLEPLVDGLEVEFGVDAGADEPHILLLLLVVHEECFSEHGVGVFSFELNELLHYFVGGGSLVTDRLSEGY
mmetsp:Transcript_35021/g.53759  ORF Transcript_35021/g.53759 Transcript_35021/m.53759 type:complete len:601 (-) Transcript_35021:128-1930(-)